MTTKIHADIGIEFPDGSVQGTAFLQAFIGANQSLAANGYQKLPGGLLIQWGEAYNASTDFYTVPFPTPFPVKAAAVVISPRSSDGTLTASVETLNLTEFNVKVSNTGTLYNWIAIGY